MTAASPIRPVRESEIVRGYLIRTAKLQSELAIARLAGMKICANLRPPTAATGGFPYKARTCAEWRPRVPTDPGIVAYPLPFNADFARRCHDAVSGSAALLDAIRSAAQ